ncbi:MAG TPA: hypothetical protein VHL09_09035 [Dehalococcoidia bacterium]|nr:hypothetical protein [Dehalococcoidia bacterium]
MPYRLIVRHQSGTVSSHDPDSPDRRCQEHDRPGYSFHLVDTWRDVEVFVYREGLKLVPCPVCRIEDRRE